VRRREAIDERLAQTRETRARQRGGRLRALVSDGTALEAVAALDENRVGSLFRISVVLASEIDVDSVIATIDDAVSRVRSEPVGRDELDGARARLERLNAEGIASTNRYTTVLAELWLFTRNLNRSRERSRNRTEVNSTQPSTALAKISRNSVRLSKRMGNG